MAKGVETWCNENLIGNIEANGEERREDIEYERHAGRREQRLTYRI
jgi:hypothetical protein